jgi:hypothetical protein
MSDDKQKEEEKERRLIALFDQIYDMFYDRNSFSDENNQTLLNTKHSNYWWANSHLFKKNPNNYRNPAEMNINDWRNKMANFCNDPAKCTEWVLQKGLGDKDKELKKKQALELKKFLLFLKTSIEGNYMFYSEDIKHKIAVFDETINLLDDIYELTHKKEVLLGGRKKRRPSTRRRQRRPTTQRRRRSKSAYSFSPPSSSQLSQLNNFFL